MVRKKSVQRSLFLEFREPWQRGLAISLGLTLGLLPKLNLIFVALLLITLLSPVSLILCLTVACVVSLISPQLSGIEQMLGNWILGHSKLQGIWESIFSSSIFRSIGFQNSQVMGSLLLALGSFYPTYLTTTIYFQRRRQLDVNSPLAIQAASSITSTPQTDVVAIESNTPEETIDEVIVDSVLRQRAEVIVPGAESLMTAHLMTLPAIAPRSPTSELGGEAFVAAVPTTMEATAPMISSQPTPTSLVYSEADIAEAERILNELVSAKQLELHQQNSEGRTPASSPEIEEQQWVLDTLIEIIRLKDEAVKSQESSTPPIENQPTIATKNLLAPLAHKPESGSSQSEPVRITTSDNTNNLPENSMDKLTRTDSGVSSGAVNAVGSSEQVERMSSLPPSPVNVVPHSARPRSMHTRDESLRFLIHHLQCLQREREE